MSLGPAYVRRVDRHRVPRGRRRRQLAAALAGPRLRLDDHYLSSLGVRGGDQPVRGPSGASEYTPAYGEPRRGGVLPVAGAPLGASPPRPPPRPARRGRPGRPRCRRSGGARCRGTWSVQAEIVLHAGDLGLVHLSGRPRVVLIERDRAWLYEPLRSPANESAGGAPAAALYPFLRPSGDEPLAGDAAVAGGVRHPQPGAVPGIRGWPS